MLKASFEYDPDTHCEAKGEILKVLLFAPKSQQIEKEQEEEEEEEGGRGVIYAHMYLTASTQSVLNSLRRQWLHLGGRRRFNYSSGERVLKERASPGARRPTDSYLSTQRRKGDLCSLHLSLSPSPPSLSLSLPHSLSFTLVLSLTYTSPLWCCSG